MELEKHEAVVESGESVLLAHWRKLARGVTDRQCHVDPAAKALLICGWDLSF